LIVLSPALYAIVAAVGWGTADYFAALSARKVGVFRAALLTQAFGVVLVLIPSYQSLPLIPQYPQASLAAFGLGLLNTIVVLSLYKSFEVGKLSLVSPITSCFPALSTLLAVLLLGEIVTQLRALGILLTLGGIVFVTTKSAAGDRISSPTNRKPVLGKGTEYALVAFVALGVLYFALKVVVADLGSIIPVLLMRFGMGSALVILLVAGKPRLNWTKRYSGLPSLLGLILIVAISDLVAGVSYNLGVQEGDVSVVSTISGCYSIVTILLAGMFLRERLKLVQWAGVLTIIAGVAVLGLAG
jgi:drug/metabolite transporter (DMT)-like permease